MEPDGQGSAITLTLDLRGPLAPLMSLFAGKLSQRNLTMELEGFRRASEPASQ